MIRIAPRSDPRPNGDGRGSRFTHGGDAGNYARVVDGDEERGKLDAVGGLHAARRDTVGA
jgi:hypothetical protein